LPSRAACAVSDKEFVQIIAVRPITAKRLGIEQSLDATLSTDSIGILVVVSRRPAHMSVPAAAEEDHCGST